MVLMLKPRLRQRLCACCALHNHDFVVCKSHNVVMLRECNCGRGELVSAAACSSRSASRVSFPLLSLLPLLAHLLVIRRNLSDVKLSLLWLRMVPESCSCVLWRATCGKCEMDGWRVAERQRERETHTQQHNSCDRSSVLCCHGFNRLDTHVAACSYSTSNIENTVFAAVSAVAPASSPDDDRMRPLRSKIKLPACHNHADKQSVHVCTFNTHTCSVVGVVWCT